jgi:hypothetical protein
MPFPYDPPSAGEIYGWRLSDSAAAMDLFMAAQPLK